MTPGILIKQTRAKRKMTQRQLADALSYPNHQFISLVENGHSRLPDYSASAYCTVLGISKAVMKKALVNEYVKSLEALGLK
jgi:transcriptional regulator with XRE-family HTH domain